MEKVLLNIEASKKLNKLGSFIPKKCYDNVYNNLGALVSKEYKEAEVKVMFAYVSVLNSGNIYTRHACYYIDEKAVDPTVINVYGDSIHEYNIHYLPILVMSIDEYLVLLGREESTDLFKTLSKVEELRQKKYIEDGAIFIG